MDIKPARTNADIWNVREALQFLAGQQKPVTVKASIFNRWQDRVFNALKKYNALAEPIDTVNNNILERHIAELREDGEIVQYDSRGEPDLGARRGRFLHERGEYLKETAPEEPKLEPFTEQDFTEAGIGVPAQIRFNLGPLFKSPEALREEAEKRAAEAERKKDSDPDAEAAP